MKFFLSDPLNRKSCDIIENAVYGICLDEGDSTISVTEVSEK